MAVNLTDRADKVASAAATASGANIKQQVERARGSFGSGRTRPLEWRRRQLTALISMLTDCAAEFRAALLADLGKNTVEAQVTEIESVIVEARMALRNLHRWTRDRKVRTPLVLGTAHATIRREPLGTVLIIGPWNYPIHLVLMPLIGALAAGNAVVLKPSEVAPACSQLIAEVVPRFLDAEAIQVVQGGVEQTTQLLDCTFDHIFYTGNGAVGSIVMTAAARTLTPVTLELGGKSPVWVDGSADLEVAARTIAWGKFSNCGQTCVAPDYVLTTPDLVEPLTQALSRATRQMYGANPRESADYGRIVNEKHTKRLAGLVDNGRVILGGEVDVAKRYVAPTILVDVSPESPVMQEEVFGPILPVLTVPGLDDAIEFINDRPKPLALYGFTSREAVREQLLEQTSSGGVGFNLVIAQLAAPSLPFGGVGESGMGRYHDEFSMATFSHEKAILRKTRGPNPMMLARPPFGWLTRKLLVRN